MMHSSFVMNFLRLMLLRALLSRAITGKRKLELRMRPAYIIQIPLRFGRFDRRHIIAVPVQIEESWQQAMTENEEFQLLAAAMGIIKAVQLREDPSKRNQRVNNGR
jgi:hypothetical protein